MKIDPERLRLLRKDKGLSRARLAERARVAERTIQRLEREPDQCQSTREHTLSCLAEALGVKEDVLTGEAPLPDLAKTDAPNPERVQIGALIEPKARLAYDLVVRRYGVNATELINMAPLFFALLAEGSLAWRRVKLKEASQAIEQLEQVGDAIGSRIFALGAYKASEASVLERESIESNDLFGEHLLEGPNAESLGEPFDPDTANPFASYLCKLVDDLGNPGVVDVEKDDLRYGDPPKFPCYDIWCDELNVITNGSDAARLALEAGGTRLGAIPENLRGADAAEARAKWLEDKVPAFEKLMCAVLDKLLSTSTKETKGQEPVEFTEPTEQVEAAVADPE